MLRNLFHFLLFFKSSPMWSQRQLDVITNMVPVDVVYDASKSLLVGYVQVCLLTVISDSFIHEYCVTKCIAWH